MAAVKRHLGTRGEKKREGEGRALRLEWGTGYLCQDEKWPQQKFPLCISNKVFVLKRQAAQKKTEHQKSLSTTKTQS